MTDRTSWWDEVDASLAAAGAESAEEPPDPWAGAAVEVPDLTQDQQAFLAGLEDQHPVPRLTGLVADEGDDEQASS
jgi:hypothetical protein